ncbi:MAG: phytanoyl-CoA dioxygenase family protein [Alphaproteobacteria bacterium]|nr:phytanoyl-CoA dioxygenase family protein [Alphaproteobacteria bacterium]
MNAPSSTVVDAYRRDGFVFPVDVLTEGEARALRADLEDAEARYKDDPATLGLVRGYPDRLLPSFDALTRHPALLAMARALLGPDLLVWSGALFLKEANTPSYVSWHQDLTYWALDNANEVTAWVALSPATVASGCMRFVPGSHTRQIVPHSDTFAADNLLTRGQEIAVDVAESDAVPIELNTGQASFHHGHLFHSSGPNTTDDRRIGAAIRYITPDMKQKTGEKTLVAHVSGEDRYGHFTIAPLLSGRLREAEFDLVRADVALKSRLLYQGAEGKGRKRG